MAFVFTVEDGTIVAGSNSYVSVAEADDYYAIDPNFNATWLAFATADKEVRLAWSTRVLDQKCDFHGAPVQNDQSLRWPRFGVCTRDQVAVARDEIPEALKEAVLEHLKYAVANDPTVGSDVDFLERIVVDVIELEYQEGTSQSAVPNIINNALRGIGHYIIGGAGFKKVFKA